MNLALSLRTTLLIAAAAVTCAALQLAGGTALTNPRSVADRQVVQLPTVQVSAQRTLTPTVVRQLPQVVVVGQREAGTTATAQARATRSSI